jgi:hypothetical protein
MLLTVCHRLPAMVIHLFGHVSVDHSREVGRKDPMVVVGRDQQVVDKVMVDNLELVVRRECPISVVLELMRLVSSIFLSHQECRAWGRAKMHNIL